MSMNPTLDVETGNKKYKTLSEENMQLIITILKNLIAEGGSTVDIECMTEEEWISFYDNLEITASGYDPTNP